MRVAHHAATICCTKYHNCDNQPCVDFCLFHTVLTNGGTEEVIELPVSVHPHTSFVPTLFLRVQYISPIGNTSVALERIIQVSQFLVLYHLLPFAVVFCTAGSVGGFEVAGLSDPDADALGTHHVLLDGIKDELRIAAIG